jgi:hypothetical protein
LADLVGSAPRRRHSRASGNRGFEAGVGLFKGEDSYAGRPIWVRFKWSDISPGEQAFAFEGSDFLVNWIMQFERME